MRCSTLKGSEPKWANSPNNGVTTTWKHYNNFQCGAQHWKLLLWPCRIGVLQADPAQLYIRDFFFLVAKFPLTCIPNLSKMPQDVMFTAWGLHAQMYVCMQALPISFPPSQVYSIYTRMDIYSICSNICLSIETSDNILRYVTQMWNERGILLPKINLQFCSIYAHYLKMLLKFWCSWI